MTGDQYGELVEFLDGQFGKVDRRFDATDRRFDRLEESAAAVEVGLESLRGEVRLVGEGVATNAARLDRVEASVAGLHDRFDRFEQLTLARFDDHEVRLRALES